MFSLLHRLRDTPLAVLDTETTGASADFGHRVIELGIVRIEQGQIVGQYQQLINPQRRVGAGITALTGITQAMVDSQPTFDEQLPAAMTLLDGAMVVGHNIRFDLSFLAKEFRRAGQNLEQSLRHAPVMDTVRIARKRFGRGGNALQLLAPRLGVLPTAAHRALADAQTTAAVFEKLIEPVGGWDLSLVDAFMHQGGPMGLLSKNPKESLLPLELEEALEQRSAVMMEYLDANNYRTHRKISPIEIRRISGEMILIAHCHLRDDRRTFKLDRIVRLTRIDRILITAKVPVPPLIFDMNVDLPARPPGFSNGANTIIGDPTITLQPFAVGLAADVPAVAYNPGFYDHSPDPTRGQVNPDRSADCRPALDFGRVREPEPQPRLPD